MQLSFKANTYIYLTVLLFLIPFPWLLSWLIAIVFHEFCHWMAVRAFGGSVYQLEIGIGGATMQCSNMNDRSRLFSILCGPFGGGLLVIFSRWMPRIAICSLFLSIYNLIPILPLDGGNALYIILKRKNVFYYTQKFVLLFLSFVAMYCGIFLNLGVLPIAIIASLWIKNLKTPCKEGICLVQ